MYLKHSPQDPIKWSYYYSVYYYSSFTDEELKFTEAQGLACSHADTKWSDSTAPHTPCTSRTRLLPSGGSDETRDDGSI